MFHVPQNWDDKRKGIGVVQVPFTKLHTAFVYSAQMYL